MKAFVDQYDIPYDFNLYIANEKLKCSTHCQVHYKLYILFTTQNFNQMSTQPKKTEDRWDCLYRGIDINRYIGRSIDKVSTQPKKTEDRWDCLYRGIDISLYTERIPHGGIRSHTMSY
jgi:hypothetical protein